MNNYSNKNEKVRRNIKVTVTVLIVLAVLNQIGRFFLRCVAAAGENIIIATLWQTIVGAVVVTAAAVLLCTAIFLIYVGIEHVMKRKK